MAKPASMKAPAPSVDLPEVPGFTEAIQKAVCANHGGFDKCSPIEIMRLWNSLPPDVQARYTATGK